jgi:hypothetical protein
MLLLKVFAAQQIPSFKVKIKLQTNHSNSKVDHYSWYKWRWEAQSKRSILCYYISTNLTPKWVCDWWHEPRENKKLRDAFDIQTLEMRYFKFMQREFVLLIIQSHFKYKPAVFVSYFANHLLCLVTVLRILTLVKLVLNVPTQFLWLGLTPFAKAVAYG